MHHHLQGQLQPPEPPTRCQSRPSDVLHFTGDVDCEGEEKYEMNWGHFGTTIPAALWRSLMWYADGGIAQGGTLPAHGCSITAADATFIPKPLTHLCHSLSQPGFVSHFTHLCQWQRSNMKLWCDKVRATSCDLKEGRSFGWRSTRELQQRLCIHFPYHIPVSVCVCLYFVKDCGIMGVVLFIPKRPPLSPVDRIPCEQLTFLQTTVIFKVGICTKVAYHVHISYLIANCGSLR